MPARIPEEELASRILARTSPEGDCLVWRGCRTERGYGRVRFRGKADWVHRVIWILTVGDIPAGLTIDHLCYNPPCVNVKHMRVVSRQVNSQGSSGSRVTGELRRAKTHCKNGHEYTPENTLVRTVGRNPGTRVCRACNAEYDKQSKAKRQRYAAHLRREANQLEHQLVQRGTDYGRDVLARAEELRSRADDWYQDGAS